MPFNSLPSFVTGYSLRPKDYTVVRDAALNNDSTTEPEPSSNNASVHKPIPLYLQPDLRDLLKPAQVSCMSPFSLMQARLKTVYRLALEFAFCKSPYPSRADKLLLAKGCGMTYKQITTWFQNRRDRSKGSSNFNIDGTTTLEDLEKLFKEHLNLHSKEQFVRAKQIEFDEPFEKNIKPTESVLSLSRNPHLQPEELHHPRPGSSKADKGFTQPVSEHGIFSFPKPNWLRKPRRTVRPRENSSPISLDQVVTQFNACRVQETNPSNDVEIKRSEKILAEEPTSGNSLNPSSGRIIRNLPRRRLPKHVSVADGATSRQVLPLPRRASSTVESAASEPSDTESATSATSLLSRSTDSSLQGRTVSIEVHSPFEKVLSWRKNNYF